jgi:hypothetical protein
LTARAVYIEKRSLLVAIPVAMLVIIGAAARLAP